jgi:hypothetical protein
LFCNVRALTLVQFCPWARVLDHLTILTILGVAAVAVQSQMIWWDALVDTVPLTSIM